MRSLSSGTTLHTALTLLLLAAAPAAASAQDRADSAASPARTAPHFGTVSPGPKHALWVRGAAMVQGRGLVGPGEEAEYERRLTSHLTLGLRLRRWAADASMRKGVGATLQQDADIRLRYYAGGQPMRGWWVGAGAGAANAHGTAYYWREAVPRTGHYQVTGYSLSTEAGYTWLLGDGARNHLGITLSAGAQRYFFPGAAVNPYGRRLLVAPRLGVGWTF